MLWSLVLFILDMNSVSLYSRLLPLIFPINDSIRTSCFTSYLTKLIGYSPVAYLCTTFRAGHSNSLLLSSAQPTWLLERLNTTYLC